jgi:hypothetical protein
LRSEQDWIACWKKDHAEGRGPSTQIPPPKSPVDFDHYTLLVATTGGKPSSGYEMIFTSVLDGMPGAILPGTDCPYELDFLRTHPQNT